MVDDELRDSIQRGLGENRFGVLRLRGEVEKAKKTKTQREIDTVRTMNTDILE